MVQKPKLSIVTTMYRSSAYVRSFYERSAAAAQALFDDIEIIFVNDGSPDDSLQIAVALTRSDPRVSVVDLSRNYGHHRAMMAAIAHASGDFVFLIDCDLEEEPEIVAPLFAALSAEADIDVAYGVQISRKGRPFERLGGSLAYTFINAMAGDLRLERNMLVARIMTRRFVNALLSHRESEAILSGLSASTGFRQVGVRVRKLHKGTTVYTIPRRIAMLVKSTAAFSDRPLIGIAYLGITILCASMAFVAFEISAYFFYRTIPPGYTSLAVSIWFLGGLILSAIGIVAQYLAIIFAEVKRRPRYIVRAVYRLGSAANDTAGSIGSAYRQNAAHEHVYNTYGEPSRRVTRKLRT